MARIKSSILNDHVPGITDVSDPFSFADCSLNSTFHLLPPTIIPLHH